MTMLAVLINFNVWMIRTQVTGGAGIRLTSLNNREFMPCVAGRAVTRAAVWINTTHPHVRPRICCRTIILIQHDFRAVALHTARFARSAAQFRVILPLMPIDQCVQAVLGNDLPIRAEMTTFIELCIFTRMTTSACAGRDQNGNINIRSYQRFMLCSHGRIRLNFVTINARNPYMGVPTIFPIIDNAWIFSFMAIDTFPTHFSHTTINGKITDCT